MTTVHEMGPCLPESDSSDTMNKEITSEEPHLGDNELGSTIEVFDRKAERRMLRKFDVSIAFAFLLVLI